MDSSSPSAKPDRLGDGLNPDSPFLAVHAINIFVRDLDQSIRFYVERLGFDLAFDARLQSGDRWVAVAPREGGAMLALVAPKPESNDCRLIGRSTGVVFVTENVIAQYREWSRRGVRFQYAPRLRRVKFEKGSRGTHAAPPEGESVIWGGVFTQFKDLDGNSFALVGFDEVTREIDARRRALAEKREAERRAAQELDIAKQVQAKLFPQTQPPIRTLEYAGRCMQARQVGGDYFDFLDLGGGRFGLLVGDIAGKGIAAALLMANLQANLRVQCATAWDQPQRLLQSVNQVFHRNTDESAYATLFFAEYDAEERRLRYVNCGHLPALLLRAEGGLEQLESTATVLGLFDEWDCCIEERRLSPGDMLALYTDGITESFNASGDEFGQERLVQALQRERYRFPEAIISSVVDEVQRFGASEQQDDITLIVAKCC